MIVAGDVVSFTVSSCSVWSHGMFLSGQETLLDSDPSGGERRGLLGATGGHAHCKILAGGNSDIYTFISCSTMYDRCEVDEKFLLIYTLLKLRYEVCIFDSMLVII